MKNPTFAILLALTACTGSAPKNETTESTAPVTEAKIETPKITVRLMDVKGDDANLVTTETLSYVEDDYFEISLYSMSNGAKHVAQHKIEEPTSLEDFRLKTLTIVNRDTSEVYFSGSTEFLNYMSKHGYELVDQKKAKFRTDYTL